MSNFDKVVKMACKPKNAPPKAKYIDQLVSATYSDDGSLSDITRSLSLRLREPNAVVVFKALLTLHQMIRQGSTDQLLEHLSQGDVLKLRNVSDMNWEGYSPPSNMGAYANYLDVRIKAFRDVKHDLVRVQNESNRRSDGQGANSRARRLRHLAVDKGLLREVKTVQRVLDALVQCRFYDDDIKEENTVLAFRMLVKDLLILFQAGNEGVCNILEHYFEMSKTDARESLDIYKSFITQTNRVVDYLGVARKLHNVVMIPVPNLKHAPTSLVSALEEYLNDPNFEKNRLEYKKSLGVVEGKSTDIARTPSPSKPAETSERKPETTTSSTSAPSASVSAPAPATNQKIQDFLDSIQADHQPTMFGGPASNGFSQFPQMGFPGQQQMQMMPQMTGMQGGFNPFRQSMMMPQQTGFPQQPFPQQQGGMDFLAPQATGAMAFGQQGMFQPTPQQPFQTSSQAFSSPPQAGFLQAQNTGSNPFRQSMMISTGAPAAHNGAFSQPASPLRAPQASFASQIQRPGSTPAFGAEPTPLTVQPTGTKNPFAPAGGVPQKQEPPKAPTMAQLAMNRMAAQQTGVPQSSLPSPPQGQQSGSPWSSLNGKPSSPLGGGGISDVASAFAFDGSSSKSGSNDFLSQFGSMSMASTGATSTSPFQGSTTGNAFGSLSGSTSPAPTSPTGGATGNQFLQPQRTGFGGSTVKPFKPSSTFGSSLLESLPPVHESGSGSTSPPATSPGGLGGLGGVQAQSTGFPSFGSANAFGQPQQQQQQPQQSQQQAPSQQQQPFQPQSQQSQQQPFQSQPFQSQPFQSQTQTQPQQSQPGQSAFGGAFGSVSSGSSFSPQGTGAPNQFGGMSSGPNQFGQFGSLNSQATGAPNPFRQSTIGSVGASGLNTGFGEGAFGQGAGFGQNQQRPPQAQPFGQGSLI